MTQEELAIFVDLFEQNTKKGEDDGCWLWQGRARSSGGVMEIYRNRRKYYIAAHRWSYQFYNNVLLGDYQILVQACGVNLCVNPAHMEVGKQGSPARNQPEPFMELVSIQETGCWHWMGYKNGAGYGYLRANKKSFRAHRVSYELFKGPIPEGLVLDHLCSNRVCVNPDHLEPVTVGENNRRRDQVHQGEPKTWKELYRDLYREVHGEHISEIEWLEDAVRRSEKLHRGRK